MSESERLNKALQALDLLSRNLIDKAAPVRFEVAQSTPAREAAFRLRYQALVDRGAIKPEEMPDGLERDDQDDRAIQVVGWDGNTAIATGRLVTPVPDQPLPTEQAFGLVIEPRGEVIDIGRYTVSRDYAQKEGRFFVGMLGFCWLEYRRIGFIVTELAPPHSYYGEDRYPCWYDVVGSANVLIGKWGTAMSANV